MLQGVHVYSEANFHLRGPGLFQIGGPSGRFATTDVTQISTTRARYIHWTSCSSWKTYHFILKSLDIRNKNSHNETNKKGSGKVIGHTHITFLLRPHWPRVSWKIDSGLLFHTLYV